MQHHPTIRLKPQPKETDKGFRRVLVDKRHGGAEREIPDYRALAR